jgi:hypothetical protein
MTKGGWISAGVLGSILWGCLSWQGWSSVVIYLFLGSLVTKIGYKFKDEKGIAEKKLNIEEKIVKIDTGFIFPRKKPSTYKAVSEEAKKSTILNFFSAIPFSSLNL